MNSILPDIVYSIFPDIGGIFNVLYQSNSFTEVGSVFIALLGISLGINFLCSSLELRF